MRVTGAYFSPTGGTKRALEALCGLLGEETDFVELTGPQRRSRRLGREDLLVLALPVYAGQIPAVPGLLDGLRGEDTPCVLMAAYGNRHYDDALAQMKGRMGELRGGRRRRHPPHLRPRPGGGPARPEGSGGPGGICPGRSGETEPDGLGRGPGPRRSESAPQTGGAGAEGPGLGHLPGLRLLRPGVPHRGHGPAEPAVGRSDVHQLHGLRVPLPRGGPGLQLLRPGRPADREVLPAPAGGDLPVSGGRRALT